MKMTLLAGEYWKGLCKRGRDSELALVTVQHGSEQDQAWLWCGSRVR